jgi:hypothetical protein
MGMFSSVTKTWSLQPCTHCREIEVAGQWWTLRDYFGVNGYLCPDCMRMVSHTCYAMPVHPEQYQAVLVAIRLKQAND